jgi:pimeloyl-ACP methyl ester carboxylesterase
MERSKPHPEPAARPSHPATPPTVSGRWLLAAFAIVVPVAAFCAWASLCLLFWQGSWQLLYHPTSAIARTPAAVGLAFDPVGFDPTETGAPQLQGWWIPAAATPRYTVLYLHGQNGNLSDTVDALATLHAANVNILAFDYRGYGQSVFAHPSESRWRQDAGSALEYLTQTRHIDPHSIVLAGTALGANLALEVAAAHPDLAGVILENPIDSPANAIFNDPRARLVPAHLLVSDRFDILVPARTLEIQSLLLLPSTNQNPSIDQEPMRELVLRSSRVKMLPHDAEDGDFQHILTRWLDDLHR